MVTATRFNAPSPLQWISLITAACLVLPTCYIIFVALTAAPAIWNRLWSTRIPELLWNTLSLATSVAMTTLVLGMSLAWIMVRYEFPGRRIWEWTIVLPLAMPTYVLAYVYAHLLGMGGPAEQWWQALIGPEARLLSPHSFPGVTLIMALDTFPFVYLLARSALLNLNVSFEEVARAMADRVAVLHRGRLEQFDTPEAIYHLPTTPFVADFVGQADFISGVVANGLVTTEIGEFPNTKKFSTGTKVVVMIRPDDIHIVPTKGADAHILGRQFKGSENLYTIQLRSGQIVHSSESSLSMYEMGTAIALRLVATHTVLFPQPPGSRADT